MTHSGLARMLRKAGKLAGSSPTPDAEVEDEKATVEAIKEVVEPVVVAIEDAKSVREADEEGSNAEPPAVFVTEPEPEPEVVLDADRDRDFPPEKMSFRQARMISWLGMVRVNNELVKIHILTKNLAERELINASWDKALASECIDALTKGNAFKHPEGWTVYLNRKGFGQYEASKAS